MQEGFTWRSKDVEKVAAAVGFRSCAGCHSYVLVWPRNAEVDENGVGGSEIHARSTWLMQLWRETMRTLVWFLLG